jgi:hypothetical protein
MVPKTTIKLPRPPADLVAMSLPMRSVSGRIYRIHRSCHECLYFGKEAFRFDDPLKQYGVLYASLNPEAAFAEVFLRQLNLFIVREQDLLDRSISIIECNLLKCLDLTGVGLRKVSCDNRISTELPYKTTNLWSRAFYDHPHQPDGILYRSRHNPKFTCLVVFDRSKSKLCVHSSEALMVGVRRTWTIEQVSNYNLDVEPI